MKNVDKKIFSLEDSPSSFSETNRFLNVVQDAIAIGSWELDLVKKSLYWSPVTKKIHEVSQDYMPKYEKAVEFYTAFKERELLEKVIEKAIATGEKYDIEIQLSTAKNNKKWVRAIGYPVFKAGKCIKLMGILQDITAKTNVYNETALKEKQVRTILEHAPNGVAVVDLNDEFLFVNKSFCEFLGYTEKDFLELKYEEVIIPELRSECKDLTQKMVDGTLTNFQMEKQYLQKNGDSVYGLTSTSLLRDENNAPLYFIKNIIDIGPTKKVEKRIQQLHETTEEQNLRLLNFAHIVSHNLRSHSGNLTMLIDLMQEDIPAATQNEYFPFIQEAVKNLSDTIDNLHEVSLINSNINVNLESLNLLEYTKKSLNSSRALLLETDAEVDVNIASDLTVLAIPAYLDSILLNIITNAIKYRRKDSKPKIKITATAEENHIKLDISDNGLGIDLGLHKDKMFGLYKTFHSHKDSRGLGLFITKNQIDAIGARITVISTVNKGSTFTIHFLYEQN
ncbi:sensor histidine kinase [Bizionia paragorgiae]|uniref:histidine kinase n=1 Tax=Bizionia paragorgiae TaxID=283786 RepID=A0A1H3VIU4_BIZPA|nr:HAMP domain-containing sensor histidine kinase [Bizionia paragorgiae]SDZ74078.1 PAS domain S-box-containing protein [Bizionia paragorgiae]